MFTEFNIWLKFSKTQIATENYIHNMIVHVVDEKLFVGERIST